MSAVLTAVVLIWNRPLLLAFGASSNTIDYSVAYMNLYALGTVFVQLTLGMNAFITAQGFAKVGMLSVLIGAVANTALDPLFIFGFHMVCKAPRWLPCCPRDCPACGCCLFIWQKTFIRIRRCNLRLRAKVILPVWRWAVPCSSCRPARA